MNKIAFYKIMMINQVVAMPQAWCHALLKKNKNR